MGVPPSAELKQVKELQFGQGVLAPDDLVVVWDRDSNNAAIRPAKDLKDSWTVLPADYRYVGIVKLKIEHEGSPVAAAEVELEDKRGKQSQVIDPSSKGEISFFAVMPGEFKVTVNFRSGGAPTSTRQGFEVSLKRTTPVPSFVISLAQPVEVAAAQPTGKAAAEAGKEAAKPSGASKGERATASWIVYVIMLLLAAGALWGLLVYIKKNQQAVAGHLKNLGVELPEPPAAPPGADPATVAAPPQPQPLQKIILQDAEPTPLVSAPPIPVAPAIAGVPSLIREDGEQMKLSEGENLVGREAGLAISLEGESTVSRKHAAINLSSGTATLKDLGSTNGTWVNGQRVDAERVLQTGDSVQFGQVRFRYES